MEYLEKRIQINESRILIYKISAGYAKPTYTISEGLFGISYYVFKNRVKYNIHGHLHDDFEKVLDNGTIEKSLYGINYIELE